MLKFILLCGHTYFSHNCFQLSEICFRGLKMWIRASSNAFAHQIEIYVGKATKVSKAGLVYDVVTDLTRSLRGKYHRVYMDNFYTSVPIFKALLKNSTYAVGTLRSNRRYIPGEIANAPKKVVRGEHKTFQDQDTPNLTCTYWGDTKLCQILEYMQQPKSGMHCCQEGWWNICPHSSTSSWSSIFTFHELCGQI